MACSGAPRQLFLACRGGRARQWRARWPGTHGRCCTRPTPASD